MHVVIAVVMVLIVHDHVMVAVAMMAGVLAVNINTWKANVDLVMGKCPWIALAIVEEILGMIVQEYVVEMQQ